MKTNERIFELLEKTRLNWTVTKNQLFDESGRSTESYGIFRNDSDRWLGTVGSRYEPFQNWEMAQIMVEATMNIGLDMSRGGFLYDGQKVYLQASLPEEKIGASSVKRWITTLNSHDGSSSLGFGSTNVVVVCSNTFHRAYGELQKFRHTTTLKERVLIAQRDLAKTLEMDKVLVDSFKLMADIQIKDDILEKITSKLFDVDLVGEMKKEVSTRKLNQIKAFIDSTKQSIREQGDSIWALYNGITRYTNHVAAPSDAEQKKAYLMDGGGRRLSDIGFTELMKFVESNTASKTIVTV